jgi:glycosyltransferase involved in cell wall biosynthesis
MLQGDAKEQQIRDCTAMIVPSIWWDPYPTVVYEAFDHGRAVLAARSGGLPESVAHGVRGLIHEPGDVSALARDIASMHQSPQQAVEMGLAGRHWLLENAGAERWWKGFLSIRQTIQTHQQACTSSQVKHTGLY